MKAALLYWDRIRRIVPPNVDPKVGWQVKEFLDRGVLINTDPTDYRNGAEVRFKKYLIPLLDETQASEQQLVQEWNNRLTEEVQIVNAYRLHAKKMSGHLLSKLRSSKLVQVDGEWVFMEDSLAGLYMACLATEMGERIGAPPVTDRPEFGYAGEYLCFGQQTTPFAEGLPDTLIKLDIKLPSPESVANIPGSVILDFHEKYADERRRFRQVIEEIMNTASQVTDKNAFEDFLNEKQQEIKETIDDHRKALDELKVQSFTSLKVSAPAFISTVSSGVLMLFNPAAAVLTGAGIGLTIISWWAKVRSDYRKETKNPWHYTLLLEKQL